MVAKDKSIGSKGSIASPYQNTPRSYPSDWVKWFKNPLLLQGKLTLVRAGEDTFATQVLDASSEGKELFIVVDRLLPLPDFDPEKETVQFHATQIYFDSGVQVTTGFRAVYGGNTEHGHYEAVKLEQVRDLEVDSVEYVATLTDNFGIKLSLFFMGEWINIDPAQASVNRLFFNADINAKIGVDGLAVPKALLVLEKGGAKIPVQFQLFRDQAQGFSAKIEKMDSLARAKLVSIIEEIWKIECGLASRGRQETGGAVGYRSQQHDIHAEAFEPHIYFLGENEEWIERLSEKGIVESSMLDDPREVLENILGKRCDLVVADADLWGEKAVEVERILRSKAKIRDIPRFWIADDPLKPLDIVQGETIVEEQAEVKRDLLDYGAFEILQRSEWSDAIELKFDWAMGGSEEIDNIKYNNRHGITALITANSRLRYRIGLTLLEEKLRFEIISRTDRLLSRIEDSGADKVALDMDTLGVSPENILELLLKQARRGNFRVMLLVRAVVGEKLFKWMKAGVSDIAILDASSRQTAVRVKSFIKGTSI
ncbi:hypothetical protein ACFLQJ_00645 [Calditrichota bacterium]